ncbi:uncharacterized protein LOC111086980 [Limulus polyphemus]|uniref:Uncharacterized protein LOC111086980 n=1 Tax=Limulus polyphemus TaxID=6850 RepID=A0ABM1SVM5_LIMPO|nr:uncharacterized protein LOC111086980 [Limulus polyphemus]
MVAHFEEAVEILKNPNKHDIMNKKMLNDFQSSLVNIDSCGLHVVNNSFKTGVKVSSWAIDSLLSALYYLFKDSPAKTEDFELLTKSSRLPLKFVNCRWLENIPVAERALEVWDNIVRFVGAAEAKKSDQPTSTSHAIIKESAGDKLIKVKINFFQVVAGEMQPFLQKYQTDRPLVCFLSLTYLVW